MQKEKKPMNFFKSQTPKLNPKLANSWLTTLIMRENKKNGNDDILIPRATPPSEQLATVKGHIMQMPEVIYSAEIINKTTEEKQKIRSVHDELSKINFSPNFAI